MQIPFIRTIVKAAGVALMFVTVVWAGVVSPSSGTRGACLSQADVLRYQQVSRSGISLICSEEIRARNVVGISTS